MTNCSKNPYAFIDSEVLKVTEETSNIKTLTLKPSADISFRAGQFMDVTIPGEGEAPFTPSSNHDHKGTLDFTIMSAGRITKLLHQLKPGDKVGLRGPYGTKYPLDVFKGKEVFIVGGGVGLAPLRALLYALFNEVNDYKKIMLRYGARSPVDMVYKNEIGTWKDRSGNVDVVATCDVGDPSWAGHVGLVTTILKTEDLDINNAVSIVCGPPIMMKFATFKLIDMGFKEHQIYLSMEKNMSCGIGKCGHCRIGPYYACKDGPVFPYDKIKDLPNIWD